MNEDNKKAYQELPPVPSEQEEIWSGVYEEWGEKSKKEQMALAYALRSRMIGLALDYRFKHRDHVEWLVKMDSDCFAPTLEDLLYPELWKPGSWVWFYEWFGDQIEAHDTTLEE